MKEKSKEMQTENIFLMEKEYLLWGKAYTKDILLMERQMD